ncbi:hypothetical protein TPE_0117 [Treponema pedis str. T A4]|uniref:Uncharacterized protein n=1 Tax=Treponema pedis str. T A4 TaxID=1291379 RepID=S5ZX89_9SPIR|nr:hypothetical protein TPE_0117 [Treponema pedis str. T A4]
MLFGAFFTQAFTLPLQNRICLSTPQKGLGWKFGFASLHVPLQSLSETRDSLGVNKYKVLFS